MSHIETVNPNYPSFRKRLSGKRWPAILLIVIIIDILLFLGYTFIMWKVPVGDWLVVRIVILINLIIVGWFYIQEEVL